MSVLQSEGVYRVILLVRVNLLDRSMSARDGARCSFRASGLRSSLNLRWFCGGGDWRCRLSAGSQYALLVFCHFAGLEGLLLFFGELLVLDVVRSLRNLLVKDTGGSKDRSTYLLPGAPRSERVEKANILEQVRVKPKPRRDGEHCDDEDDQPDDGHSEEQPNETEHAHAEVPYSLPHEKWPEWEQHNCNDKEQRTSSIEFHLPLGALV
jgi:hypothetical protein